MDIDKSKIEETFNESIKLGITSCENIDSYELEINNIVNRIDEDYIESIVELFKALNNDVRLKILSFMIHRKKSCLCEISNILNIDSSTLTYHLNLLKKSKLLKLRKSGKSKIVTLAPKYETLLPQVLLEHFSANF